MVYNQTVCNENATWFWRGAGEEHVSKEKKKKTMSKLILTIKCVTEKDWRVENWGEN